MISASKLKLDVDAETKRLILSSIASNFDILLFNGPLLNRSRRGKELDWDTKIPELRKIAKQINTYEKFNSIDALEDKMMITAHSFTTIF
ncbi:hypothetical protein Avbf_01378 [Armadillidium vulgare]|nr:hypothetical protein Avbf_01378 [Armadillidium vulgare]